MAASWRLGDGVWKGQVVGREKQWAAAAYTRDRCLVRVRSAGRDARRKAEEEDLEGRLERRLQRTLAERQLLRPREKVLVAVSGGQDSAALIRLLAGLQPGWGWWLGIVHCDHQWSASSRSQAAHVAQIAAGLKVDYFQAVTTKSVLGEGVARVWRYGVLQKIAISHGYGVIVTAHTASDRVETMLYNLFRGSGLRGLQSLAWKRELAAALCLSPEVAFGVGRRVVGLQGPGEREGERRVEEGRVELVRPLLDTTRTEIRKFGRHVGVPLWPDPSNHSLEIDRNRIRHQLLPYLRHHFQAEIDKSLARCAEILQGEDLYLDGLCHSIRSKAETPVYSSSGEELGRRLNVSLLQALPVALQRRILKQFLEGFTGKGTTFDHVERLRITFLQSQRRVRVSLPGGFSLQFCGTYMVLREARVDASQQ